MVTFDAYITRSELSLTDLSLRTAYSASYGWTLSNPEEVLDTGAMTWRKTKVTAAYVDGDFMVNRVKDESVGKCTIVFNGYNVYSDHTQLQLDMETVIGAFSQISYDFHITLDGASYAWKCRCADYALKYNRKMIHALSPEIVFTFDRHPVPVAGLV